MACSDQAIGKCTELRESVRAGRSDDRLAPTHQLLSIPAMMDSKPRRLSICSPILLAAALVGGCDEEAGPDPGDGDGDAQLLVRVTTADDLTIQFLEGPSGTIIVSEYGTIDTPSALAFLLREHDATPLEVLLAVTDGAAERPREIVIEDEDFADRLASDEPPRALQMPDSNFRTVYDSYGAANCSYASDHAWFVDTADGLGWDWRWYWYGQIPDSTLIKNTATKNTSNFFTHLCHFSGHEVDHLLMFGTYDVEWWQPGGVEAGYRSTIWTTGVTKTWHGRAWKYYGEASGSKLGAIAP